jgi:hypothetical protein
MTRLHLGCGMKYLEGYVNVDYPPSLHSVQNLSVADIFSDITELKYNLSSIEEIRLHHVFEHFSRPKALALLASWNSWLQPRGNIRIEVPDMKKSAKIIISPFSSNKQKMKSIRHLFGSHEASWAYHLEGYTATTLQNTLEKIGFSIDKKLHSSWNETYNIEIFAHKNRDISYEDAITIGKSLLYEYLIDENDSEMRLLGIWLDQYRSQLDKSYASGIL